MMKLSWKEIQEKYPAQQVGLSEVEWENGRIAYAVVKYSEENATIDEITERAIKGEVFSRYTEPDSLCHIGALSVE